MAEEKKTKKEDVKKATLTKSTPKAVSKAELIPELKSGMTVKIHEKIKDVDPKGKERTRVQIFEGMILATKKLKTTSGTILVRKMSHNNIGVEKIYPVYSPLVDKIEVIKQIKTRRAKLTFMPTYKKRLKVIKK